MNTKRKALVKVLESVAGVAQDFKGNVCKSCTDEILCFSGSIDPRRIRKCRHLPELVRAFVGLAETGVAEVHSNLSIIEINLEGLD